MYILLKSVPGKKTVLSNEDKVSCSRKKRMLLMKFKTHDRPMSSWIDTHCVMPPLLTLWFICWDFWNLFQY